MIPYQPVPRDYQLQDNGIDPRQDLFSAPRNNQVVQASSGCFSAIRTVFGCLGLPFMWGCMYTRVKPMHDTIIIKCGVVSEVLREPGPYCLNPCCMETHEVYMGLSEMELINLPINDSHGSPLIISAQFVYRVADSIRAKYATKTLQQFLKDQGGSALRAVCGRHPFDVEDGGALCLRKHSDAIDEELKNTLQTLITRVGIVVDSFRLTGITVAHNMEKLLLARQEAQAELTARKTIADGSAGIIQELVNNYRALGINLSDEELNRFAMDLTLILVNHGHTTLNIFEGNRSSMAPPALKMVADKDK
jgi:hypothetical protein